MSALGGHLSLLSTGETHLEYWVQVWAPGCKTDTDFWQKICQRAMGMIKGLEHLKYEDKMRKLRPFRLEKIRLWGISSWCINIWWGKRERQTLLSKYLLAGWEAMDTNRTHEILSKLEKKLFLVWEGSTTWIVCLEMLWNFHFKIYSKSYLTWPWATSSRWHFFEQGIGLDDFQTCLLLPATLWVCESSITPYKIDFSCVLLTPNFQGPWTFSAAAGFQKFFLSNYSWKFSLIFWVLGCFLVSLSQIGAQSQWTWGQIRKFVCLKTGIHGFLFCDVVLY